MKFKRGALQVSALAVLLLGGDVAMGQERKEVKIALHALFQKEGPRFVDRPLALAYWKHGGEPGDGTERIEVVTGASACKAILIQTPEVPDQAPRRTEKTISSMEAKSLFDIFFKSPLFEKTFPSEEKPNIADVPQETWELKGDGADLQTTFYGEFPSELDNLRLRLEILMQKLSSSQKKTNRDTFASIDAYLVEEKGWAPSDYRLDDKGLIKGKQLREFIVVHKDDEKNPVPGGGKSIVLHVDTRTGKVVKESGMQ